jgi:N-acyl-D-aspartate/D-glutamate deacylase
VLQLLSDFLAVETEWGLIRRMAETSGRPLSMTVAQNITFNRATDRFPHEDLLARMSAARDQGLQISAQVAPRAIGVILGLSASLHPFLANPVFAEIARRPVSDQLGALRRPEFRRRLLDAHTDQSERSKLGGNLIGRWERMVPLGDPPDYEPRPESSVEARAAAQRCRPEEVALDLLLEDDGRGLLYVPLFNYLDWNFEAVRSMLVHPCAVPGLSDAGAHVGTICDGSFPTFLLAYWGRQRREGRLPVEWIVERQSRATARTVGLWDRGTLAPGYRADLNVIDLEHLGARRPELYSDLPAGGRRFLQRSEGYRHTFVAGVEIFRDGSPTGELPGCLVRGPQPPP